MLGFGAIGGLALGQLPSVGGPFNSAQINPPVAKPRVSVTSQVLGSSMMLLTTIPLVQSNRVPNNPVRIRISAPDQVHTDIGRFTNPVPFNSTDRPQTLQRRAVQQTAPDQLHTNIGRFTNPVPFQINAQPLVVQDRIAPARTEYSNLALTTVVATAPFYQTSWPAPRGITLAAPDQAHTNINLFANPLPFSVGDLAVPRQRPAISPALSFYNLALLNVAVTAPFYQTDWPAARRVISAPPIAPNPFRYPAFYSLSIVTGTYAISGNAVAVTADRRLPIVTGTYVINGNAVAVTVGYKVAITAGVYVINGNTVAVTVAHKLPITTGVYTINGNAVGAFYGRTVSITTGVYVISGNSVTLPRTYIVSINSGAYVIVGNPVTLTYSAAPAATDGHSKPWMELFGSPWVIK